jgi:hypothetical protein
MVVTRYSAGNFALLLFGTVVALGDAWAAGMTMAFGADPVHDMRSGAVMIVLWASLALIPASLIAFRWPVVGAILSWSLAALCGLCVWSSPVILLFLILAVVEGLIATNIASRSEETPLMSVTPK